MKANNKEDEIIMYCRENNLQLMTVLQTIIDVIETYFNKKVYFDDSMTPRFVQKDKKITISKRLEKYIHEALNSLAENKKIEYKVGMVINATIVSKGLNGFFLKTIDDFDCYLNKKNANLDIGDKDYFTIYKIKKNIIYLRKDKKTIKFLIKKILKIDITIIKYIPNKLIIFEYYENNKKSINHKLLKTYFDEKIIYNKKVI